MRDLLDKLNSIQTNEGVVKEAGPGSLQAAYDEVYEYVDQLGDEALEIMDRMAPKFSQALSAANGDVAAVEANSSPKAIAFYMGELEEVEGELAGMVGMDESLNRMRSEDDDFPELKGFDKVLGPDPDWKPGEREALRKAEKNAETQKREYRKELITFDMVKPAAMRTKKELEDIIAQMDAGDEDAFDPDARDQLEKVDELLKFGPGSDGNDIEAMMGTSEANYIGNYIYSHMFSYNKDAATVLFSSSVLRDEKDEPWHQAAKNLMGKEYNESLNRMRSQAGIRTN